ncbi:hypothetical protein QBC38DRAFT_493907 [Podospora fimiseda]|uniref:Uncharacterized protein n=1 Tax=Podospora fimiseda TaxID=252190 RepID=A0AAN6YQN6_9PEZI|nr:hypothetical protein QBC38DRAFT_493907 [Podospora fimiseda]
MKSAIYIVSALFLASSTFAAPQPITGAEIPAEIEARAPTCKYRSYCSAFWSGKCESHCSNNGYRFKELTGAFCLKGYEKACCCV